MIKMIIRTPRTPNVIETLQSGLEDNLSGTERENNYYTFYNKLNVLLLLYYYYNKDENNNNESKTHPNTFIINMTQIKKMIKMACQLLAQ